MAQKIDKFTDGIKSFANSLINSRSAKGSNEVVSDRLSFNTQNEVYKSGLGSKIVSLKINTAFKEGLEIDGETEHDLEVKKIIREAKEAARWMLVFGRGVIAIIEDGVAQSEPLRRTPNLSRVRIKSFDGSMVTANSASIDVTNEDYMKPDFYVIRGTRFHKSRIIDFSYVKPREEDLPSYWYGGISEYELIYNQIINDGVVERASASIVEKNASLFYKVKGFKNLLSTGKEKSMLEYFKRVEDLRSIYGAGVLDAEDSVEVVSQTLTNLQEVDMITLRRLSMVTSIPLAILVGESVKGLGATGANEMETFYVAISNLQDNYLIVPINELFKKLGLGEKVEFIEPEQMTKTDRATLDSTILDNATKLQMLGQDPNKYLSENGFEAVEDIGEFGEFDEGENANTTE